MERIKSKMRYFLFFLFCLTMAPAFASNTGGKIVQAKHAPLTLQTDTLQVNPRQFSSKKIQDLTKDPEFQYGGTEAPGQSFWSLFWRWLWNKLFSRVFSSPESNSFFYYLFVGLGVIFVIYLLLKVSGIDVVQVFKGESKSVSLPYTESLENIHEIDFESETEEAIRVKNFRLAVRLLYLSCLKSLNDQKIINWQIEKTNNAYINEVPEGNRRQNFRLLTRQFEYIWYGDFPIDFDSFQSIQLLFQQFKQVR
ncbi:MAG: hypothetical protein ACTHJ8_12520 [Mucilaginibacter sp.]|jgi:hypothetical protein